MCLPGATRISQNFGHRDIYEQLGLFFSHGLWSLGGSTEEPCYLEFFLLVDAIKTLSESEVFIVPCSTGEPGGGEEQKKWVDSTFGLREMECFSFRSLSSGRDSRHHGIVRNRG